MFKIEKSQRDKDENRFTFLDEEGDEQSMPLMKYAPTEAVAAFEQGQEMHGTLLACDNAAARAVVARLDSEQLEAFTDAWLAASKAAGASLGESEGSTDS